MNRIIRFITSESISHNAATLIRRNSLLSLFVASTLLAGCASVDFPPAPFDAYRSGAIAYSVRDCQSLLSRPNDASSHAMPSTRIGLLNWNMKKGSKDFWQRDLQNMAEDQDLVLLQEAVLASGIEEQLSGEWYRSFSQGFTTRSRTTGVATYSKYKPVSECRLSVIEPWLRSRKAMSVTEFGLGGRDETLLVVNVHVVNISFGLTRFRDQIGQVRDVLEAHDGPAILSGDFNTWRQERVNVVNTLASDLDFTAVNVDEDHRRTFNGHALDHVFVRGLTVSSSQSKPVTSSDHNPITVELNL